MVAKYHDDMESISLLIPKKMLKELDKLAKLKGCRRSNIIKDYIYQGLNRETDYGK